MSYRAVISEQNCRWLLIEFPFLEVCMHLIANFTCNDTIFERIFISDLSIWILVFSMLNLHFSVTYKAF